MKSRIALVGLTLVLVAAMGSAQQSALDAYARQNPAAVAGGEVGPFEARILDALTPEQAEEWAAGADPESIVLEDGTTLADLLAALLAGGKGLVYVPLDSCLVVRTLDAVAGAMAVNETRPFVIRGLTTDLSAQGGSATGCGVPTEAVAVVMHFRALLRTLGVAARLFVNRVDGPINPTLAMEYKWTSERRAFSGASVVSLCEGACASGEFEITTSVAGAHVRADVIGYFRPIEAGDLPGGMGGGIDADTLDGLDSTAFALDPHTHPGEDITSGTVADARIDAAIARDAEVFGLVLTADGSGSMLDSDLLDGRDSLDLMLQVDNCLTVSPSCPAVAADALAARCWQTISAALGEIGVGLPAATAMNKYLIKVGPGIYTEQVSMKPFVDIEGAGQKVTTVTFQSNGSGTLFGADNAELRSLTVESDSGLGGISIAMSNSNVSPMVRHVTLSASGGTGGNIAMQNVSGASPMLVHVTAVAADETAVDRAVSTTSNSSVAIRDSVLQADNAAAFTALVGSASIVNTQLIGPAAVGAPTGTFTCLGAYDAAFAELGTDCQP